MGGTTTAQFTAPELVMLFAHWLSMWLGLYLLSRKPRSATMALAGSAYLAMSTYLLSTAILSAPERVPHPMIWGGWLGGLMPFAPPLLLHAFLRLTGTRLPQQRLLLALAYTVAGTVFLAGLSDTLLYRYWEAPPGASAHVNGTSALGPLYPLQVIQVTATLLLAFIVLARSRRARRSSGGSAAWPLDTLMSGTALMLVSSGLLFANAYLGSLTLESFLQPILMVGAVVVAVPLARYPGLVEGQLLRSDLKASLLGAAFLMASFLALVLAAGASIRVLVGVGWFVIAVFVLRDDLRSIVDYVFYGAGSRAGRAGLRAAADYAGATESLDLETLAPGQSSEVIGYMSALERAGVATARLEGAGDPRLTLLGRDEFAVVRDALGLAATWRPEDGLFHEDVRVLALEKLEPRERQALGLKYLGYSDKEMARLMEVRPGVPRSYLSEAKRKLRLPAGAPTMLYVHFADLVASDALPVLEQSAREGAQPDRQAGPRSLPHLEARGSSVPAESESPS